MSAKLLWIVALTALYGDAGRPKGMIFGVLAAAGWVVPIIVWLATRQRSK